jgi:acetolactate synthase small subunit
MSKNSTLNFLINSYYTGAKDVKNFPIELLDVSIENDLFEMEPSKKSIDAILSFASQYDVLKSEKAGNIELNLN